MGNREQDSKVGSTPDIGALVERIERLEEQVAALQERMNMSRHSAILSEAQYVPK